jgi:uncharacterized protein (TIGR02300 family)
MSKPARGTKRVCQNCGARFYDLGRAPIVCPLCQTAYQAAPPPPPRRSERQPPPEPRQKPEPEVEIATLEPETISLEDIEEGGEEAAIEAEIADIGDDADIPAGDDDTTFLEESEGDEETDVTGIVGGSEKEES